MATSPLSIAVPGDEHLFLLDMATATIALGKIAQHRNTATPLPEGAAAMPDGTPTTDPGLATMPSPLGGAKGSGMSLGFELMTSVLVGAPILADHHSGADRQHRQNALLIALDPTAFGGAVLVPGDRSAAVAAGRRKEGVPLLTHA